MLEILERDIKNFKKVSGHFTCRHCSLPSDQSIVFEDNYFCCYGCLSVYKILSKNGLNNFYKIKGNQKTKPLDNYLSSKMVFLEDEIFLNKNIKINLNNELEIKLYISNISCVACLWLIEKIPEHINGVVTAKLNYVNSILSLTVKNKDSLRAACLFLDSIGYRPYPITNKLKAIELLDIEADKSLRQVAVAGMISGNIMLFAISIYAGAVSVWSRNFSILIGLLFVPILLYCSKPFFSRGYIDLKNKKASIDLLVSLALIIGGGLSYYNLFTKSDNHYFDSLSVLVFLLLFSRYYLRKVQLMVLKTNSKPYDFLNQIFKTRKENKKVSIEELEVNDEIIVCNKQMIPCSGVCLSKQAYVNRSFLTGESDPVKLNSFDKVLAGDIVFGEIEVQIQERFEDSKLYKTFDDLEQDWLESNDTYGFSKKYLSFLIKGVLFLAVFLIAYFYMKGNVLEGFNRVLALMIITCPCALGLGIPLVFTLGLKKLAVHGIFVRKTKAFEQMLKMKNFFFDKTGTLTHGEYQVKTWDGFKTDEVLDAVFQLESRSSHPIAKALEKYILEIKECSLKEIINFKENLGTGTSGILDSNRWEIKKAFKQEIGVNTIDIFKNNEKISSVKLMDQIDSEGASLIEYLKNKNKKVYLISGDSEINTKNTSQILKLDKYFSNCSPEEKEEVVREYKDTVMIGDGMNDIKAMKASDISISLKNNLDFNFDMSHIAVLSSKSLDIKKVFLASSKIYKILISITITSLLYNVIGMVLAAAGKINPLVAAILMPVSVILITSIAIYRINIMEKRLWK